MNPELLFYIIISVLIINFFVDKLIDFLNAQRFNNDIPEELKDIYDENEYKKSQAYKKTNYVFSLITSTVSLILILAFFQLDGFEYIDLFARSYTNNKIFIALIFFGSIIFVNELFMLPFSYYHTFVIEEKFGFNKSTVKLFFIDKLKGWFLTAIIGGALLSLIIWFYSITGKNFWIYAWAVITVFTLFTNMFYSKLIVPLFNKQKPLEVNSLKIAIENYAKQANFKIDNIFVIDGSKRSTKANAYFSGFGKQKRITLYDTLINDLEEDEIVAVLAHEVGHYKRHHILYNMFAAIVLTGIMLYLLALFINIPELSLAIGVLTPSFHAGLITFGILYAPISASTGLIMKYMSRKFEYQADNYAKRTYSNKPLINALKKLSKNSLSNLTPHPAYVFIHYSHPTLLERYNNLLSSKNNS